MSEEVKPFKVNIPSSELDRLREKLQSARYPKDDVVPDAGSDYGFPNQWAMDMLSYWKDKFSWSEAQKKMNRWPHFTTEIEGQTIHFIHQRSSNSDAIPLLLVHGWPGSFHEFSEVIDPLTQGSGDEDGVAFHCIVPSLPGFAFSSPPQRRGWTVQDTARVFHNLMQRLGYNKYCAQAGDWGQFPVRELGAKYSNSCSVIHLNWCPGALPENLSEEDLTDREKAVRDKAIDWRTNHIGYAVLMRTRPHALGWMLQDNPLGLLAFVGEKYQEASNPKVHNTDKWRDHILTTVCLYYFTDSIMTSALVYYENTPHHNFANYTMSEENHIKCPFSYTSYWFDTSPNSKRAVERTGHLVSYKERDYAGHFACLEDPEGVVEDTREVVSNHWAKAFKSGYWP